MAQDLSQNLSAIQLSTNNSHVVFKAQAILLALLQDDIENVRQNVKLPIINHEFLSFALDHFIIDDQKYNYIQEGESMVILYLRAVQSTAQYFIPLIVDYPLHSLMLQLGMFTYLIYLPIGNLKVSEDTPTIIGDLLNRIFVTMNQSSPGCIHTSLGVVLTRQSVSIFLIM